VRATQPSEVKRLGERLVIVPLAADGGAVIEEQPSGMEDTRPSAAGPSPGHTPGGVAAALVAALVVVVGVLLCRAVVDVPVPAPEGDGVSGDVDMVKIGRRGPGSRSRHCDRHAGQRARPWRGT
jgi:hypothetical protein